MEGTVDEEMEIEGSLVNRTAKEKTVVERVINKKMRSWLTYSQMIRSWGPVVNSCSDGSLFLLFQLRNLPVLVLMHQTQYFELFEDISL